MYNFANILRGGAVVARRAHNPKVIGSSPIPATKGKAIHKCRFFILDVYSIRTIFKKV